MNDQPSIDSLQETLTRLTDQTLDPMQRVGHLLLVLAASTIAAAMGYLLLSEFRTEFRISRSAMIGLWIMLMAAIAWVAYGLRVLSARLPLLANRNTIDARLAILFTATFTAGAMAFGWLAGAGPMTSAAWFGLLMLGLAVAMWVCAKRRYAALQALRIQLEQGL